MSWSKRSALQFYLRKVSPLLGKGGGDEGRVERGREGNQSKFQTFSSKTAAGIKTTCLDGLFKGREGICLRLYISACGFGQSENAANTFPLGPPLPLRRISSHAAGRHHFLFRAHKEREGERERCHSPRQQPVVPRFLKSASNTPHKLVLVPPPRRHSSLRP